MTEYIDTMRLKLAYRIATIFLFVFLVLTYAYYFDSTESFYTMSLGVLISATCLFVLYYYKNHRFVLYTYSICGVVVTAFALITFHETVHLADILWMLAAVSLAFFGIGKKMGFILLFLSLGSVVFFMFYSLNINIRTVEERSTFQQIALVLELIAGFSVNIYLYLIFLNFFKFSQEQLLKVNDELRTQNALIKEQDEEKTVLVKEVHHRVKNNLQIIVSLLRNQMEQINNPMVEEHFQESINRIIVMSQIHKNLYSQESLKNIHFSKYVDDLAQDLVTIYGNDKKVEVLINSKCDAIGLRSIVPLGLLLNELITNSLKYAFSGRNEGKIFISFEQSGTDYLLTYSDNGNWIEREAYVGFGLSLISTLTEQLDGTKELITSENETSYYFQLKDLSK